MQGSTSLVEDTMSYVFWRIDLSVLELCRDAQSFDKEFETVEREAGSLDKYYIPTRYPDAPPGGIPSTAFDEEDARRAIGLAEKIAEFVKKKL